MASSKPSIAFIGLGAMGGGMATNLVDKGYTVIGYDTYSPLIDKLTQVGGRGGKSPRDTVTQADFVISMVANAAQNEAFLFDGPEAAVKGMIKASTFILCSTCPPDFAVRLRKRFDDAGRSDIQFLDCPVSGGTLRAADGTLSIFASGPDAHLDDASDILKSMSANLYRMGPIPNGSKTKTAHQLLAATNIISSSEAMALAATVGLNTRAVYDFVNKSDGASFMFENRVPHMLKNDWQPYSALSIILKDAGIVTDTARKAGFNTPLASSAEQEYLRGVESFDFLKDDDARCVQMYLPKSKSTLVATKAEADVMMIASHKVSKDTIADLLAGIHLAASIECMAFCKKLELDRKIMYDIVSKAAGWSAAFVKYIPAMLEKDEWTLADCSQADDVGNKLADAVAKCRAISFPCPMGAQASQQFYVAKLRTQ